MAICHNPREGRNRGSHWSKPVAPLLYSTSVIVCVMLGAAVPANCEQPPTGALSILGSNPHYFADPSGKPIFVTGCYTWGTFSSTDFDYTALLESLKEDGLNYSRVWLWWGCDEFRKGEFEGLPEEGKMHVEPYLRTGSSLAHDGRPKYDLSKFNPEFFSRLRDMCSAAKKRGIYLQLCLTDAWALKSDKIWQVQAYNRDNNINGIDGDPKNSGYGDHEQGCLSLRNRKVLENQKAYIRKVVDTVNDFDNVLFEIANENYTSEEWETQLCDFIHEYEKSKPKQHLVMPKDLPNHWYHRIKVQVWDAPLLHESILKARLFDQPIVFDTDGIAYPGADNARRCVWTAFASGAHVDHLDRTLIYRKPSWQPALSRRVFRKQLGFVASFAKHVKFWEMQPNSVMVKSGTAFVMASANELIGYLPNGGSVSLDLAAMPGEPKARWYDPLDGTIGDPFPVRGGGEVKLQAPDGNDWALLISGR
jgi:hypothetical protein